eukprot:scaffold6607_cov39-Isochrysis_galbana.AAC.1
MTRNYKRGEYVVQEGQASATLYQARGSAFSFLVFFLFSSGFVFSGYPCRVSGFPPHTPTHPFPSRAPPQPSPHTT